MQNQVDIKQLLNVVKQAGEAIMDIYKQDFSVDYKEDNSPLTLADKKSNQIITQNLQKLYPDLPIMSEEIKQADYEQRKNWDYFWVVDPLDGTKEFVKKNDEFCINLALVYQNKSVLGIIYLPAKNVFYWAVKGKGAYKKDENDFEIKLDKTRPLGDIDTVNVVGSRSHKGGQQMDDYISNLENQYSQIDYKSAGSALKFGRLAEGEVDIYPRMKPCMERDTAAGHVIINEVGKDIYIYENGLTDKILTYNKPDLVNPYFVAL